MERVIKAIIFDLFGVLSTEGFKRFCDKYFPDDQQKRRQALDLVTAHDWGKITQSQYAAGLAELAGVSLEVVADHMQDNQPNDALLDLIRQELKPKYKIGVLSNSGGDYIRGILAPQDLALFDDIVLSYQYRLVKPDEEFFNLAASRLGAKAEQCVMIDDSANHVDGARRTGMQAILYKNFPQLKSELETILKGDGQPS